MTDSAYPKPKVYIAAPLTSSGTPLDNVRRAMELNVELMRLGYSVLCPHLSWFLEGNGQEFSHAEWIANWLPWVESSDIVIRPDWGPSPGADMEARHAGECGIPVVATIEALTSEVPA